MGHPGNALIVLALLEDVVNLMSKSHFVDVRRLHVIDFRRNGGEVAIGVIRVSLGLPDNLNDPRLDREEEFLPLDSLHALPSGILDWFRLRAASTPFPPFAEHFRLLLLHTCVGNF
jgi:hypothetical protein